MSKQRLAPLLLIPALALVVGCGEGKKSSGPDQVTNTCTKVSAAVPKPQLEHLSAPTQKLPEGSVWNLQFKTNCGNFTIRVDAAISPNAASSFVSLAKSGFFDGLSFHRLAPGFVIQGGDPSGTGAGGPGYKTVDKPDPSTAYPRGTVAMAKTGTEPPGTAGSQFFIVTADHASLPADFAVLGTITNGKSTPDLISSQDIDVSRAMGGPQDGPPKEPIVIESVKVSRAS